MKFKYIGEHEGINFYGVQFGKEPVDVEMKQVVYEKKVKTNGKVTGTRKVTIGDKIKGHPDFEEVKSGDKGKSGKSNTKETQGN